MDANDKPQNINPSNMYLQLGMVGTLLVCTVGVLLWQANRDSDVRSLISGVSEKQAVNTVQIKTILDKVDKLSSNYDKTPVTDTRISRLELKVETLEKEIDRLKK